jgi:hypothetical protein
MRALQQTLIVINELRKGYAGDSSFKVHSEQKCASRTLSTNHRLELQLEM